MFTQDEGSKIKALNTLFSFLLCSLCHVSLHIHTHPLRPKFSVLGFLRGGSRPPLPIRTKLITISL